MMQAHDKLPGEFWLNETLSYSGVAPHFTNRFLSINSLTTTKDDHRQLDSKGPHLIVVPMLPPLISNIEKTKLIGGVNFSFSGPYLGHMDMLSGRTAADEGPLTRFVEKVDFDIRIEAEVFHFSIAGRTGPLQPRSKHGSYKAATDSCTFRCWFNVSQHRIPKIFEDPAISTHLAKML